MKKTLGLGLVCLMLSNTAFASKARLLALGMDELDNEGSYYIDDVRNIFLNAANINNYANTMMFEWGAKGQGFGSTAVPVAASDVATVDLESAPKAGGGFLMQSGSYVWGLYLGNESNTSSMLKVVGSAKNSVSAGRNELLSTSDNQLDFFLGSEANGVKWGANLVYTKSEDKNDDGYEDDGYAVRLGAITDQWNAFANISLGSTSKGSYNAGTDETHEFDGKLGFHVGGAYNLSDSSNLYTYIKRFDWEQNDSGAAAVNKNVDAGFTTYAVGYGHQMNTGAGTLFSTVSFRVKNIQVKYDNKAEANNTEIPLTIGYEAEATSWLILRGSVTQNLYGTRKSNNYASLNSLASELAVSQFGDNTSDKKVTMRDSTDVRAGLSLNFGKLVVDGLISTTAKNAGHLNFDDFMSRVGATYSF